MFESLLIGVPKVTPNQIMYYSSLRGVAEQQANEFSKLASQRKSRLKPKVERQTNSVTAIAKREINSAVSAVRNAGRI